MRPAAGGGPTWYVGSSGPGAPPLPCPADRSSGSLPAGFPVPGAPAGPCRGIGGTGSPGWRSGRGTFGSIQPRPSGPGARPGGGTARPLCAAIRPVGGPPGSGRGPASFGGAPVRCGRPSPCGVGRGPFSGPPYPSGRWPDPTQWSSRRSGSPRNTPGGSPAMYRISAGAGRPAGATGPAGEIGPAGGADPAGGRGPAGDTGRPGTPCSGERGRGGCLRSGGGTGPGGGTGCPAAGPGTLARPAMPEIRPVRRWDARPSTTWPG